MASRNDLIYDRTQQDIINAYNTAGDNEDKRGCFNASDLNRICDITNKIVNILNTNYGAEITGDLLKTDYTASYLLYSSEFYSVLYRIYLSVEAYNENNLQPEVEQIDYDTKPLDYIRLNKIEKALYDMCIGLNIN